MLQITFLSIITLVGTLDNGPVDSNPPGRGCESYDRGGWNDTFTRESDSQSTISSCGYTWPQCFEDTHTQSTLSCIACANGMTGSDRDFAIDACLVDHCDTAAHTATARDCYQNYATAKNFNDQQLQNQMANCKQQYPNDLQRQGLCITQAKANWASNESGYTTTFHNCITQNCP